MSKIIGYRVSCPRIPEGRVFKTLEEARKEQQRQMLSRAKHSGISEIRG
jgi:hypothetical protein